MAGTHWLDALTPPLKQHLERLARSVAALLAADDGTPGTAREGEAPVSTRTAETAVDAEVGRATSGQRTVMEQQIRFCTTSDGVRIAYATVGKGSPLIVAHGWVSHLQVEWDYADTRAFWQGLAEPRLLVRFDKRGTGLSDWDAPDLSMEGQLHAVGDDSRAA